MSEEKENSSSIGIVGLIVIGVLIWGGYQFFKQDTWQGIYELPTTNTIGALSFDSKEACSNWLEDMRINPSPADAYGFECGSNCKPPKTELGLYQCEETF